MLQCRSSRRIFASLRCARGHCLADEGEGLVAVEAAEFDDFSVEREALRGEDGLAEADAACVCVDGAACVEQANVNGVELRGVEVPKLDAVDRFERDGVAR